MEWREKGREEEGKKVCCVVLRGTEVVFFFRKMFYCGFQFPNFARVGLYVGYVTPKGQVAFSVGGGGGLNTA